MQSRQVRIIEEGKLIILGSMHRELGIATGDTVLVNLADDELRDRSFPLVTART